MKCNYRLVMLGAGGVGKSSLLLRFLDGHFDNRYRPTVDDLVRRTIQLPDGDFHSVEFLDTAGLHQFPAMRHLSILSGRAFVVVYSVDSYSSFKEALYLSDLIRDIKGHNQAPMILVGNKSDLASGHRKVSTTEAQNEAAHRHCAFIETSARNDERVHELFMELMVKVFTAQQEMTLKTSRKTKRRRRQRKHEDRENNNVHDSRCSVM